MGFFEDAFSKAFRTGIYICPKCGKRMQFENDETRDTLVCLHCGYDMDIDHYGLTDEEYDNFYPTKEQLLGREEDEDDDYLEDGADEVYDEDF